MRKLLSFVLTLVLIMIAPMVQAASTFTLWTSQTFTAPFDPSGRVATSAEVNNANNFRNLELLVKYEALNPVTGTSSRVFALVEKQIAGIWVAVAQHTGGVSNTTNAPSRFIILQPLGVRISGQSAVIGTSLGNVTIIEYWRGTPGKFRVALIVSPPSNDGSNPLMSVTVSVAGELY